MPIFTIEVSGAELEVISLAIGRMPDAKPVRAKPAKRAPGAGPRLKPPTLPKGQWSKVEERWAEACKDPEKWHANHVYRVGRDTNRTPNEVLKAWGLPALTAR